MKHEAVPIYQYTGAQYMGDNEKVVGYEIVDENNTLIALSASQSNAERIAACLTACDGIELEELTGQMAPA